MATSGYAAAYEAVRNAYQQYLGREPESSAVIEEWLQGDDSPESIARAIQGIETSPEAQAYQAKAVTPPVSTTDPVGGGKTVIPGVTPAGGFQAKHDFSAFDTAREQNPQKSAKDAFAMLSNQAPPPPFHDKPAMAAWFNQHIKPGMDALGHKVSSVDGDKFSYSNHEGNFTVDYAQNAGAASGSMLQRVQWGAEAADDATRQRYAPGGSGAGAGSPTLPPPRTVTPPLFPPVTTPAEPPPLMPPIPSTPPVDVPMASLQAPLQSPARLQGDVPMSALAAPVQSVAANSDDLLMQELAQQRAARTRNLRWNAGAA